jgi:hypothetical protein
MSPSASLPSIKAASAPSTLSTKLNLDISPFMLFSPIAFAFSFSFWSLEFLLPLLLIELRILKVSTLFILLAPFVLPTISVSFTDTELFPAPTPAPHPNTLNRELELGTLFNDATESDFIAIVNVSDGAET